MSRALCLIFAVGLIGCGGNDSDAPVTHADAGGGQQDLAPVPTIDLAGDAAAPADAMLLVDDSSYQFDPVAGAAASAPATFKITNRGGQPTPALAVDIHGDGVAAFHIVSDDCSAHLLAPGASCHVAVDLGSTIAGDFAATLRVHADPGGVARVDLSGEVTAAALAFSSPTLSLGGVFQGASADGVMLTLGNSGGATSGVVSLSALAAGFSVIADGCSGKTVVAGGSCSLKVGFAAAAAAAGGDTTATLTASAAPGGNASIALTADVLTSGTISVSNVDFGSVGAEFGSAAAQTMTVTNVGDQAATITSVSTDPYSNNSLADFIIDSSACLQKTLQPQQSCALQLSLPDPAKLRWSGTTAIDVAVASGHAGSGTAKVSYYSDGYWLFVGPGNGGMLSITSPDGQTCASSDCNGFRYPLSTTSVVITAHPQPGYHFSSWYNGYDGDDACVGVTTASCTVTFNASHTSWAAEPIFAADSP